LILSESTDVDIFTADKNKLCELLNYTLNRNTKSPSNDNNFNYSDLNTILKSIKEYKIKNIPEKSFYKKIYDTINTIIKDTTKSDKITSEIIKKNYTDSALTNDEINEILNIINQNKFMDIKIDDSIYANTMNLVKKNDYNILFVSKNNSVNKEQYKKINDIESKAFLKKFDDKILKLDVSRILNLYKDHPEYFTQENIINDTNNIDKKIFLIKDYINDKITNTIRQYYRGELTPININLLKISSDIFLPLNQNDTNIYCAKKYIGVDIITYYTVYKTDIPIDNEYLKDDTKNI
jgi:hypothetical protein